MSADGETINAYVLVRPGALEFIQKASEIYELVIFTASMPSYANPLLDKFDPKRFISYRLFRQHCSLSGFTYVKDISLLGRDLKDTIIIDNSPTSYLFQPFNALPITTWFDDKNDTELYDLLPIISELSKVNDVREYLKKIVKRNKVDYNEAKRLLYNESDKKDRQNLDYFVLDKSKIALNSELTPNHVNNDSNTSKIQLSTPKTKDFSLRSSDSESKLNTDVYLDKIWNEPKTRVRTLLSSPELTRTLIDKHETNSNKSISTIG